MQKKDNKIIVCIASSEEERRSMISQISIALNFAGTIGDAKKLIRKSVHDIDLINAYFVMAEEYNFKSSPHTTHRLYELAARGIAVIIGTRKLPPEFEFICKAYYPTDFNKV